MPDRAYPDINQPQATAQVDAELAKVAELRNAPQGAGGMTPTLLRIANAVAGYRQDRIGAIAGFMQTASVGTEEERRKCVLLPGGEAWRWLLIYGHMAGALDTLRGNARTRTRFDPVSLSNFDRFLGYIEADGRIVDVRWMAYMFATAYWEAAHVISTGKKRPNGQDIKAWETVVPIAESGKGKTSTMVGP